MEIYICIGSSCHQKGSYSVINLLKQLIAEHELKDKVNLSATFCVGHCQNGITMKIDDQIVTGVNADNITNLFEQKILKELQA